jgi:hypothetical protein
MSSEARRLRCLLEFMVIRTKGGGGRANEAEKGFK